MARLDVLIYNTERQQTFTYRRSTEPNSAVTLGHDMQQHLQFYKVATIGNIVFKLISTIDHVGSFKNLI